MNLESKRNANQQKFRLPAVAGLTLACVFAVGSANAQWAVVDLPHTIKTGVGWVAQYQQMISSYQQQIQQYQTQIKQYEQQYVKGDAYKGEPGYREKFQERGLNDGAVARCGEGAKSNPVGAEQYQNCVTIVQTENRRYNAMVKVLADVEKRDQQLKEARTERESIGQDEQGKLVSNTNRTLAIQSQMQNDVQNAGTLMNTYDTVLLTLKADQVRIANSALKKQSSLFGTAAQGLALKAALQVARSRER